MILHHQYSITDLCICVFTFVTVFILSYAVYCCLMSLISTWQTLFSSSYKTGLVITFCTFYLRRSLFPFQLWWTVLGDIVFLVCRFFLLTLGIYYPTPFWQVMFLLRKLTDLVGAPLYVMVHVTFAAFKINSLLTSSL